VTDPIEPIRRWLEGFNARDVERMVAVAHPEIELRPMRWVQRAEYRGHAGVRQWLADITASGHDSTVSAETIRSAPDGRIVVEGAVSDDGGRFIALYEVRDDRIASVRAYLSDRELLEHVGLLEGQRPLGSRS
jgi:ketosteroid isomerase-like protein